MVNGIFQIRPEFGTGHMMVRYVCKDHCTLTRDWWRCTVMDSGELCVMTLLIKLMLTLYAGNWDTIELLLMTT